MIGQELFETALALICEDPTAESGIEDYTERAPYLLSIFISLATPLDAAYRQAHGLEAIELEEEAVFPLTDAFPLCGIFSAAAVYYLAAMLVLEENEEMSDRFFSRYCETLATIESTLPASAEKITDTHRWY